MKFDFSKWTTDYLCQQIMKDDYENYLSQFSVVERETINEIVSKFDFYDNTKCARKIKKYAKDVVSISTSLNNYCIVLVCEDNKPHNSCMIYTFFKEFKSIKDKMFYSYTEKVNDSYLFNHYSSIFIIDDYSGSGDKIIEMLSFVNFNCVNTVNVELGPMIMTKYAKERIDNKLVEFTKINVSYSTVIEFRDALVFENALFDQKTINDYLKICDRVRIAHPKGYNDTEDIIAFSFFTPNNTLGLLWEDSTYRLPFLSRVDNLFTDINQNIYLQDDFISELKSMINSKNTGNICMVVLLSLYLLIGIDKTQIMRHLKCKTDDDYNSQLQKSIDKEIICKNNNKYCKGEKFGQYVDEKAFTKLYHLNIVDTRKKQIENSMNLLIQQL